MNSPPTKYIKYCIIISLSLFILGGAPIDLGTEKTFFHGYLIQKPIIRIGLGVNLSDIDISSSSGMKIYEVNSGYRRMADDVDEVRIKGRKEKLTEKFVIQITQTREKEEAEIIAQKLETKIQNNVYVKENAESNIGDVFQVRVGDFITRGDALNFIKKLKQIGISDAWILREEITEDESKPLWILIRDELMSLSDDAVLYFIPNSQESFLSFNGRDYRGIFILKSTLKGIVLVNILNIEDYLKSVVPSELSPYNFNELEAHKAQAVAARTYAIRNLGMNKELGFDLDDSPKSQFYQGMSVEHPLSSRAVELTKGKVARYRGKLINALYTSTCGGMTEDAENIFGGLSVPYLKSTECTYEKQNEWQLKSNNILSPIRVRGRNINSEIAYLISLRVIPPETEPFFFEQEASFDEAQNWIKNTLALLKKKDAASEPSASLLNHTTLASLIVNAFDWNDRVENLMLESERDFIMRDMNKEDLESNREKDLAYLIQAGIFPTPEDFGNPKNPLTRGELAFYLMRIIYSYRELSHHGTFKRISKETIELEEKREKRQLVLSPELFLLRNNEDFSSFASQVTLLGGEYVKWIESEGKVHLLEIIYPPQTNILDRSSPYHRWQLRVSREALERRVNQFYPIGKLIDIIPQRRGESKRLLEILLVGEEDQAIVKGFRIRKVLGLREILFVTDREYDREGSVTHFTFWGRGFGHGVGLCQVGAVGMAQTGADYEEILKKYYRGIKLRKIY
ncbi:MAG: SpoIID/LytB domain-containing protein [Candidatus Aminicenantes bacterium]|nr:MAG: SpoIID/LytB domain-containing protein [Candidatus Aminicenantes bacterium]